MPCCTRPPGQVPPSPSPLGADHLAYFAWRSRRPAIELEYVGRTSLTVVGPATGRPYRFARTGARLPIAPADSMALAAVPNLRRVPDRR